MAPFSEDLKALHTDLFKEATQHEFLAQAGKGTIAPGKLAAWLVQDEFYQHAYIPFIGQLLAKLRAGDRLPSTIFLKGQEKSESVENNSLQHRLADAFVSAITALRAEESFFATTVRDYGLAEHAEERTEPDAGTAAYLELIEEIGAKGSLLDGLTLLWGTEYVYLNAWKFAASKADRASRQAGGGGGSAKSPSSAVAEKFVPNWTSPEFESFVDQLSGLLNELATREGEGNTRSAERVWKRALECELDFWPQV